MVSLHIPFGLGKEKIVLLIRPHLFILITRVGLWLVIALVPLFLYQFVGPVMISLLPTAIAEPVLILAASIFYLYVWLFAFTNYVLYYLDVWVVTTDRIINAEQDGLFARVTSEQRLYRVQDVTAEQKGFFATVLNYGNVYIQTAGEKERFAFKQVPAPSYIAKKIIQMADQNRKDLKITPG